VLDYLRADRQQAVPWVAGAHNNGVRAVLFDAGDILYHRPRRNLYLRPFLQRNGRDLDDLDRQARKEYELQAYQGRLTQDEFREAVIRCYGITDPVLVEEGRRIIQHEDNDLDFYEGVSAALHALKGSGFMLGIITDTAASISEKLKWFKAGGFGSVWDTIISSAEIGVRKPHPGIYLAALQQLGISARQAIFVGHKASELDGAHKTGMLTAAFNYEPGARADYYIDHFSDLVELPVFQQMKNAERKTL